MFKNWQAQELEHYRKTAEKLMMYNPVLPPTIFHHAAELTGKEQQAMEWLNSLFLIGQNHFYVPPSRTSYQLWNSLDPCQVFCWIKSEERNRVDWIIRDKFHYAALPPRSISSNLQYFQNLASYLLTLNVPWMTHESPTNHPFHYLIWIWNPWSTTGYVLNNWLIVDPLL